MTSSTRSQFTAASTLILAVAPAYADSTGFQGFYAPDTWTITGDGIGGSSAIFAADGSELVITGADGGFGSTIHVEHTVLDDGIWTFHWSFYVPDGKSPAFDAAYYTINDTRFFLSDAIFDFGGTIMVPVTAGQTIGWQVVAIDGIFGAGVLTITDFRASVPSPAAFVLLSLAALPHARCRR